MRIGGDDPEIGARVDANYDRALVESVPVARQVGRAIGWVLTFIVFAALVAGSVLLTGLAAHVVWRLLVLGWRVV